MGSCGSCAACWPPSRRSPWSSPGWWPLSPAREACSSGCVVGPLPFYLVGLVGFLLRPENLPVRWILVSGSCFAIESCLGDVALYRAAGAVSPGWLMALAMLRMWMSMGSSFGALGLTATFPSGRPQSTAERAVLWTAGIWALLLPLLNALSSPTLAPGLYAAPDEPAVSSGLYVEALGAWGPVTAMLYRLYPMWVLAGLALLVHPLPAREAGGPPANPLAVRLGGGGTHRRAPDDRPVDGRAPVVPWLGGQLLVVARGAGPGGRLPGRRALRRRSVRHRRALAPPADPSCVARDPRDLRRRRGSRPGPDRGATGGDVAGRHRLGRRGALRTPGLACARGSRWTVGCSGHGWTATTCWRASAPR